MVSQREPTKHWAGMATRPYIGKSDCRGALPAMVSQREPTKHWANVVTRS